MNKKKHFTITFIITCVLLAFSFLFVVEKSYLENLRKPKPIDIAVSNIDIGFGWIEYGETATTPDGIPLACELFDPIPVSSQRGFPFAYHDDTPSCPGPSTEINPLAILLNIVTVFGFVYVANRYVINRKKTKA